jgi:acetolactate synthase I/II/III large subunit
MSEKRSEPLATDDKPDEAPLQGRRAFMSAAATLGLGLASGVSSTPAAESPSQDKASESAKEDFYSPQEKQRYFVDGPGSDYMVEVLTILGIKYVALNPGASFRGLHESLINSTVANRPQIITCLHEEQAVAFAHGYAKASGTPMAVACHGTVGFQHAAMAVYNAWCDHVPILILGGNHVDSAHRPFPVVWDHSAQDPIASIRDAIKWDDQPGSLQHFCESAFRAYRIAMTPPMGPVAISIDSELQERSAGERPTIPRFVASIPTQGDAGAVHEAAKELIGAQYPVIVVDRCARSQAAVDLLVQLAELLQAPVIDRGGRMNFPNTHYLNQSFTPGAHIGKADVILALELKDIWGVLHVGRDRSDPPVTERVARSDVRLISLGSNDLFIKSNYQTFQRFYSADIPITGDAQGTLPVLIEEVRRLLTAGRLAQNARRATALRDAFSATAIRLQQEARYGWDATPITTARLCMELWNHVSSKDWAITSPIAFKGSWPNKLWRMTQHYQHIGDEGGYGIGYGGPASVGAALAHHERGRIAINLQGDGDLMFAPGALWTAAHHKIPLLTVMHNNAGYVQETMLIQTMALQRRRGVEINRAKIGTEIDNPRIDFSTLARSMGVWAEGPITDPQALSGAITRALAVIESGAPALLDVISQPR